jgi:hypothetical protein
MASTRFTCTLTTTSEPACQAYARVTITDAEGTTAPGCPRHTVAALFGLTGAHMDWADSRGALLGVGPVVGAVEREVAQRGGLGLEPVQPGRVSRHEHQLDVVSSGPAGYLGVLVRGEVIGDQVAQLNGDAAGHGAVTGASAARRDQSGGGSGTAFAFSSASVLSSGQPR